MPLPFRIHFIDELQSIPFTLPFPVNGHRSQETGGEHNGPLVVLVPLLVNDLIQRLRLRVQLFQHPIEPCQGFVDFFHKRPCRLRTHPELIKIRSLAEIHVPINRRLHRTKIHILHKHKAHDPYLLFFSWFQYTKRGGKFWRQNVVHREGYQMLPHLPLNVKPAGREGLPCGEPLRRR